jgi:hypothetical protein
LKEDFKILGVSANLHDAELEGACGKCCAECGLFYRKLDDNPELKKNVSQQLGINVAQNELRCEGCTSLKRFVHISECPICFCNKDRGVNYCRECGENETCTMRAEISNAMIF